MKPAIIRIAIIDDHKHMREGLKTAIESSAGFEVVGVAEDEEGGVKLVRTSPPEIVLLDMELPDGESLRAARGIRRVNRQVKIVGLCVYSDTQICLDARNAGANIVMEKAVSLGNLLDKIRELCIREKGS